MSQSLENCLDDFSEESDCTEVSKENGRSTKSMKGKWIVKLSYLSKCNQCDKCFENSKQRTLHQQAHSMEDVQPVNKNHGNSVQEYNSKQ